MKFKTKLLSALSLSLCSLFFVGACSNNVKVTWDMPQLGENVTFLTQLQQDYLNDDYNNIQNYAKGTEELSRPQAVNFTWSATPENEEYSIDRYVLEISQSSTFTGSVKYETTNTSLDVYNLCVATDYYWHVTAYMEQGKVSVSPTSTFTTNDNTPRNIYVDGITNMRDLGGWQTEGGDRVNQGLIYRCGRLNESERATVNIEITEKGIAMMKDVLGVKSEIDLRMPNAHNTETGGITSSPLGEDVNYYNIPMEWDIKQGNFLTNSDYVPIIKQFFEILADKSNYPVIFHCNIGTDRTGFFTILINGLLGVSEEDLYRDYLFSNFGKINGTRSLSNISSYMNTIKSFEGINLSRKIENCLLSLGVPQSNLDAVKDIMLG